MLFEEVENWCRRRDMDWMTQTVSINPSSRLYSAPRHNRRVSKGWLISKSSPILKSRWDSFLYIFVRYETRQIKCEERVQILFALIVSNVENRQENTRSVLHHDAYMTEDARNTVFSESESRQAFARSWVFQDQWPGPTYVTRSKDQQSGSAPNTNSTYPGTALNPWTPHPIFVPIVMSSSSGRCQSVASYDKAVNTH